MIDFEQQRNIFVTFNIIAITINEMLQVMQHISGCLEAYLNLITDICTSSEYEDIVERMVMRRQGVPKVMNYRATIRSYNLDDFRSHFRITKTQFEPKISMSKGRPQECLENKLLLTLWTLSNQESFRSIADRFGYSKGNAHSHFMETCKSIAGAVSHYIKWPGSSRLNSVMDGFNNLRQGNPIKGVVGAVDCTHILIPKPSKDAISYYDRYGTHSVILQCICDSEYKFTDIFVGWPGRAHDATVWKESAVYKLIHAERKLPEHMFLLGDSAYPCTTHVVAPFKDNGHLTRQQRKYNYYVSSLRVVIEQAFGILKGKFRRLFYLNMRRTDLIPVIITACCILHNLALTEEDEYEFPPVVEVDSASAPNNTADGLRRRNDLLALVNN